jgi:competence protein ComEC
MRGFGLLALLIGCQAPAARADRVVPAPGVTTPVTVRHDPNSDSAPVGELLPGQSAVFVSDVPRWYGVVLANGTPGFVSKVKTDLVADAVAPPTPTPAPATGPTFTLHAMDVGTGLAVLVQGPDFNVLYDAGSNDDKRLVPDNRALAYLALAVPTLTTLDDVILSHPHRDHVELLADVLATYEVREVWDSGRINNIDGYRRFIQAVDNEPGVIYHTAIHDAGTATITVDGQSFSVLHGPRISTDETIQLGHTGQASMHFLYADGLSQGNPNNNSLVMRLDLGPIRVLFMGDAEGGERENWDDGTPEAGTIEATLLACCPSEIDADVLIVGHHGSKTSSRTAFLDAVSASTFVVSSGPTKYGSVVLPDAEVIAALMARGAVLRTDIDDAACRTASEKVGDDADGRAGGCSNIRLTIGPGSSVTGSIWVGDEEID